MLYISSMYSILDVSHIIVSTKLAQNSHSNHILSWACFTENSMTPWLLKAGKMFVALYIGLQHYYFPLAPPAGFHILLEILEQAEHHNQSENQAEAEAYSILHADDSQ